MTPLNADFLWSRLPAFYQQRDAEQGGALRALLEVLAAQGQVLDDDISRLYDNWFIETCEDWLVPYIGDLLGVRGLYAVAGTRSAGQRALVANTLALRRRKGTLPVLELLALDVTGWRAHAVEFFQQLGTTQYLNHQRLFNVRTPDLRHAAQLERTDGPFDTTAHTAEVRGVPSGRYNIPHIGIYIWRLQAYPVRGTARKERSTASKVTTLPGFYTFDPLGRSVGEVVPTAQGVLYNLPRTENQITDLAQPVHVPEPLSRRVLHNELTALQQALAAGQEPVRNYFAAATQDHGPVLRIWLDDDEVTEQQLLVCNLRSLPGVVPTQWRRPPAGRVGFDPVLGRIALPKGKNVKKVEVNYAYGFVGDVGGGPYDRRPARVQEEAAFGLFYPNDFTTTDVQPGQSPALTILDVPSQFPTLAAALAHVVAVGGAQRALIRLDTNATEDLAPNLHLPNTELCIEAVNQRRPVLVGDWTLSGNANTRFGFSGVWLHGAVHLLGPLRALDVRHCSLSPALGGIRHTGAGGGLAVALSHSICGPVQADEALAEVSTSVCIVDGRSGGAAFALPDTPLQVDRCTVFGTTNAGELEAANSVFNERVRIARRQQGCVRFCYLPLNSTAPRRYRCQPELALEGQSAQERATALVRVVPTYTSVTHGAASYAQLRLNGALEILHGAEDGGEMGVWNILQHSQREANLRQALDEYLRFGMQAGVIFVN